MRETRSTSHFLRLASLVALSLFLPSCGDDAKQQGSGSSSGSLVTAYNPVPRKMTSVAVDAGKLISADAVLVARVRNIGEAIQKAKAIAESFKPGAGNFVDVTPLLQMAGLQAKDVDMTGSALVALSMTKMGPPATSYIVPATDAKNAAEITSLPSTVSGKYLGLSMGAKPVVGESTPPIAGNLPAADYAIRVNLKALLSQVRTMIEPYLDPEALATLNPRIRDDRAGFAMLGAMAKSAKQFLDVAEQLDIAVSLNGGALDLDFALELGGKKMAAASGRAITLAQMLPMSDAAMYMCLDADWSEMVDLFMPTYESLAAAMPVEEGKAFMEMVRKSMDLYKGIKGAAGFAFDITPQGIQGMGMIESENPAAYVQKYMSFMKSYPEFMKAMTPGVDIVKVSAPEKQTIDDVDFHTLTLNMDLAKAMRANTERELPEEALSVMLASMEAIFGKNGMKFGLGAHENLVLLTVGDVKAHAASLVAAVKKGQQHPSAVVEHAAARLHARPIYFMGVDLRRCLQQIKPLVTKVARMPLPDVPAGAAVIVWMSVGATQQGYEFQAHIDLAGIAELVRAMMPR